MNLKENDQIPNSEVFIFENNAPVKKNLHDLLKGKKAVIFGLPGAYTSVCSAKHLPGYVNNFDQYKEKGVDHIICISVNDPFVMNAWGKEHKVEDKISGNVYDYLRKHQLNELMNNVKDFRL